GVPNEMCVAHIQRIIQVSILLLKLRDEVKLARLNALRDSDQNLVTVAVDEGGDVQLFQPVYVIRCEVIGLLLHRVRLLQAKPASDEIEINFTKLNHDTPSAPLSENGPARLPGVRRRCPLCQD